MELFYNPERMSETEIKETFVAYQWLVDEIVSIIKRQPKGAGVQHIVIVAPRGMGKTTLLLMLRFTVLNQNLAKRWQPVLFPEESYSVYDLADLWVEVLDHIASETGDVALRDEVKKLKEAHPNSSSLEAIALASIKDWRDKNKKRLLLLVDNFDMILEQIGDEKDNASLRDVLMNDGTMMLVGGSTTFFKEARAYDQPLYNLFKIYNLDGLDSAQTEDLLRRRAKIDGIENFEEILRANRSRLRVLEYFTGGNPRLVLMLYRVLTQSDITEVRRGLEKLLDEVTPYYKAKIETLPPQQRKILDQIARISAQTREGLTPTEIASATRLAVNQVSSQLKRLADVGYVRIANIRGRSSYYTLSEPLYAIWYQMRFSRDARMKMNWLVSFLKDWYDAEELGAECRRLQVVFRKYLRAGREKDARNALEHRRYLMEAIEDQSSRLRTFENIILSYLELSDTDTLKRDVLTDVNTTLLSKKTRQKLIVAGLLTEDQIAAHAMQSKAIASITLALAAISDRDFERASRFLDEMESQFPADSLQLFFTRALNAFIQRNLDDCLTNLESVLQKKPDLAAGWTLRGIALLHSSRFEEAEEAFRYKIKIDPDPQSWCQLAGTLGSLERHEEAITAFDEALRLQPESFDAFLGRSRSLAELARTDEALSSVNKALSLRPDSAEGWNEHGEILANAGATKEALESFDRAIALKPDSYHFLFAKAWTLGQLDKTEEALHAVNKLLELDPSSSDAYFLKGLLLICSDFDSALINIKTAFDSKSSSQRIVVETATGRLYKIYLSVLNNEIDQLSKDWSEFVRCGQEEWDQITWIKTASNVLRFIVLLGHKDLAKELLRAARLEQSLFPLARALDYLLKREEALIEKLSPEVRRIVDEIVTELSTATPDGHIEIELSQKFRHRQYIVRFTTRLQRR